MGGNCGWLWQRRGWQFGQEGDDRLNGGDANDRLYGRGGHDRLAGGAGHDWLFGGDGDDWLDGGDGNDVLFSGRGRDQLYGGAGDDWLIAHGHQSSLDGGGGADRLYGGCGDDQLAGGAGNDVVFGGWGDDRFTYLPGDGSDYFDGGCRGTDVIRLDLVAGGWTLDLSCGRIVCEEGGTIALSPRAAGTIMLADGSVIRFRDVERIEAVAVNQAPVIAGISADSIIEHAADGSVVATVLASDADTGDGLTYALTDDAGGRFEIDPETGVISVADGALLDHASASQHSITIQVTDAGGLSHSLTTVIGVSLDNSGDDSLGGDDGDNVIEGGAGHDLISGEAGNDQLSGGAGNDEIDGGEGDDVVTGDDGNDLLFGGDGDDQLSGGAGTDQLHGGVGDDQLDGGDGDDSLFGNVGDDLMTGDAGSDRLFGSMGNDVLAGGAGNDTISGSSGADRFLFSVGEGGVDTVTDFGAGDVLVFTGLTGFAAGQEADFVSLLEGGGQTTVLVDPDGAANGSLFDPVAVLNGVTGTSLTDLVNARQIELWTTS